MVGKAVNTYANGGSQNVTLNATTTEPSIDFGATMPIFTPIEVAATLTFMVALIQVRLRDDVFAIA